MKGKKSSVLIEEKDSIVNPFNVVIVESQNHHDVSPERKSEINFKRSSSINKDFNIDILLNLGILMNTDLIVNPFDMNQLKEFPQECENVYPMNNYIKEELIDLNYNMDEMSLNDKFDEEKDKFFDKEVEEEDEEEVKERRNSIIKHLEHLDQKIRNSSLSIK